MQHLRPIPRRLLHDSMDVYDLLDDGTFASPKHISHVRFQKTHAVADDGHRSDCITGKVYVDVRISGGAYEVPAGSKILINGVKLLVKSCLTCEDVNGNVHHWELVVA